MRSKEQRTLSCCDVLWEAMKLHWPGYFAGLGIIFTAVLFAAVEPIECFSDDEIFSPFPTVAMWICYISYGISMGLGIVCSRVTCFRRVKPSPVFSHFILGFSLLGDCVYLTWALYLKSNGSSNTYVESTLWFKIAVIVIKHFFLAYDIYHFLIKRYGLLKWWSLLVCCLLFLVGYGFLVSTAFAQGKYVTANFSAENLCTYELVYFEDDYCVFSSVIENCSYYSYEDLDSNGNWSLESFPPDSAYFRDNIDSIRENVCYRTDYVTAILIPQPNCYFFLPEQFLNVDVVILNYVAREPKYLTSSIYTATDQCICCVVLVSPANCFIRVKF
jgi:hypothetical protein